MEGEESATGDTQLFDGVMTLFVRSGVAFPPTQSWAPCFVLYVIYLADDAIKDEVDGQIGSDTVAA